MLQTTVTKQLGNSRVIEFANVHEGAIALTQIEHKNGLTYMRMKKRLYVFT